MAPLLARYSFQQRPRKTEGPRRVVHAETLEVNLIDSGREVTDLDAREVYRLGPGGLAIIPAGRLHSSWTEGEAVAFHNVHLYDAALDDLVREHGVSGLSWGQLALTVPAGMRATFSSF